PPGRSRCGAPLQPQLGCADAPLRVYGCEPRPAPVSSARLAVSGVAPAPAAVLAQLEPFRVIPFALVGLVVTALALFTSKSRSDPNISTGHLRASRCGVCRTTATGLRACQRTPPRRRNPSVAIQIALRGGSRGRADARP